MLALKIYAILVSRLSDCSQTNYFNQIIPSLFTGTSNPA